MKTNEVQKDDDYFFDSIEGFDQETQDLIEDIRETAYNTAERSFEDGNLDEYEISDEVLGYYVDEGLEDRLSILGGDDEIKNIIFQIVLEEIENIRDEYEDDD